MGAEFKADPQPCLKGFTCARCRPGTPGDGRGRTMPPGEWQAGSQARLGETMQPKETVSDQDHWTA